jgi:hypothetical protein
MLGFFVGSSASGAASTRYAPDDRRPVVYVAPYFGYDNNVTIFDEATGARLGALVLPQLGGRVFLVSSIGVDAAHNVYVGAQYQNRSFFVAVYPPRASQPSRTFEIDGANNIVAVAPSGELAVLEAGGVIEFYAPGAGSPTSRVQGSSIAAERIAFEPDGTLWVFGTDQRNVPAFADVGPGKTRLVTRFEVPTASNSDLFAIDRAGNLAVTDGSGVQAFTTAGAQAYAFPLGGTPAGPNAIAFSSNGKSVFLADPSLSIEVFPCPQGGLPVRSFGYAANAIALGSL